MTGHAAHERPPVFIVSTGRCGSTLLSNMLRLHPRIVSLSEFLALLLPDPFPPGELSAARYWRLLSEPGPFPVLAYQLGLRVPEFLYPPPGPGSRFSVAAGIPPIMITALPHLSEQPEELYGEVEAFVAGLSPASAPVQHRRLFGWLRDRFGADVWAERSGASLRYVARLAELFPDARFVHVYRDGRECAYSMSHHPAFRLGAVSAMLTARLGTSPYFSDAPLPAQIPPELLPFLPGTFGHDAFERFPVPAAALGKQWADAIMTGLDVLGGLPASRVLSISYEELTADPRDVLARLVRFAGLAGPAPGWLGRAAGLVTPRPPRWPSLPPAEIAELTRAVEPAMRRLYGGMP
jgi:sulfotransferase family protein